MLEGTMKKPKTIPQLKKQALDLYSEFFKLKAFSEDRLHCFTCDSPLQLHSCNTHLGHYLSRGAYPGLTFHPDNSRVQCFRCNVHLHGNTIEFRQRLIEEIGVYAVEELEGMRHNQIKWSRSELNDMIILFKTLISDML